MYYNKVFFFFPLNAALHEKIFFSQLIANKDNKFWFTSIPEVLSYTPKINKFIITLSYCSEGALLDSWIGPQSFKYYKQKYLGIFFLFVFLHLLSLESKHIKYGQIYWPAMNYVVPCWEHVAKAELVKARSCLQLAPPDDECVWGPWSRVSSVSFLTTRAKCLAICWVCESGMCQAVSQREDLFAWV